MPCRGKIWGKKRYKKFSFEKVFVFPVWRACPRVKCHAHSVLCAHAPSPASTFSSLKPTPHAKVSSSSLPKSFVLVSKESEPRKGTAIALAMDGWGRANRNLRRCEDVQPKWFPNKTVAGCFGQRLPEKTKSKNSRKESGSNRVSTKSAPRLQGQQRNNALNPLPCSSSGRSSDPAPWSKIAASKWTQVNTGRSGPVQAHTNWKQIDARSKLKHVAAVQQGSNATLTPWQLVNLWQLVGGTHVGRLPQPTALRTINLLLIPCSSELLVLLHRHFKVHWAPVEPSGHWDAKYAVDWPFLGHRQCWC